MNSLHLTRLEALRAFLAADRELIEPVRGEDGVLRWDVADVSEPFVLQESVPLTSLKPYFFAERETVFAFDGTHFRSRLPEAPPRVFFGVKACDAAALAVQDRFFAEDAYYQARRRPALVVATDCAAPCAGGFCPLTDSGPLVREGADLVLTPVDDGWLAAAMTVAGEATLEAFLVRAEAGDPGVVSLLDAGTVVAQRAAVGAASLAAFPALDDLSAGLARLQAGEVSAGTWEALAIQCLACSGCVNLCPSCSCFTTHDTSQDQGVVRERVWDACLYEGFQREASGHHPSPTPGARTARYWFHKFSPVFLPQQGRLGCTGCGRCDAVCPGVIGAKAVLRRVGAC